MWPEVSAAITLDSGLTIGRGRTTSPHTAPSVSRGDPPSPWRSFLPATWLGCKMLFLSVHSVMIPVSYKGRSVNETWHRRSEAAFKLKYYRKGSTLQTFDVTAQVSEGSCEYRSHCRRHRVCRHFQEGEERADRVNKNNPNWVSKAEAVNWQSWLTAPGAPSFGKYSQGGSFSWFQMAWNASMCGGHMAVIFLLEKQTHKCKP